MEILFYAKHSGNVPLCCKRRLRSFRDATTKGHRRRGLCGSLEWSGQQWTVASERKLSFSESYSIPIQCVCVEGEAPSEHRLI